MNWGNIGLLLWIGRVCLVIQMQSKLVCENLAPMFMHVIPNLHSFLGIFALIGQVEIQLLLCFCEIRIIIWIYYIYIYIRWFLSFKMFVLKYKDWMIVWWTMNQSLKVVEECKNWTW